MVPLIIVETWVLLLREILRTVCYIDFKCCRINFHKQWNQSVKYQLLGLTFWKFSRIMLKNGEMHFKNLAFIRYLYPFFNIMHERHKANLGCFLKFSISFQVCFWLIVKFVKVSFLGLRVYGASQKNLQKWQSFLKKRRI